MKPSDYVRKGWTQGTYARDKHSKKCEPKSKEAVRWCALGAVMAWTKNLGKEMVYENAMADCLGIWNLEEWNDSPRRTKAQVLGAMVAVEKELGL